MALVPRSVEVGAKARSAGLSRYLVSRLSALGDVVCTLPVATALKTLPGARVEWLVDPRFAGIVECCPDVDQIHVWRGTYDPRKIPRLGKFEVALDLQGLLKSALPLAFLKARRKLGYHWRREGSALFAQAVLPDPSSSHVVDQYVDVARAAGADVDRAEWRLKPKAEDVEAMKSLLAEHGIEDGFVMLNAGAGWATKRWPPERFAEVADALDLPCVLIGGKAPADLEAAQAVIQAAKRPPANLLGKTSVRQLVALVALAKAHVGGDTGSSHLAAALGIPAIGLYAITRPKRSCPYGQIERCLYEPSGLAGISTASVLAKLREVGC